MHLSFFFLDLVPFVVFHFCFAFAASHLRFCSAKCWSRENLFGSGVLGFCGLLSRLISLWCLIWFSALVFDYVKRRINGMMKKNRLCRFLALFDSDVCFSILIQVYLYGAHVTSWKNDHGEELLFLSSKVCVLSVMERVCVSSLVVSSLISYLVVSSLISSCFSFNSFVFFSPIMCCNDGME